MSYWVPRLIEAHGFVVPFTVQLAITVFFLVVGLPVYLYGQRWRAATREMDEHIQ